MIALFERRLWAGALAAACLSLGAAAQAATITPGSLLDNGIALDLSTASPCGANGGLSTNVGSFSGYGDNGSGKAACGDKSTTQVKDGATPFPYGRYDPNGGAWIDSNDLSHVAWNVDIGKKLKGVSFALTDAHDQKNSWFRLKVDGATWSIKDREANGTLHLITILFDQPVDTARIRFSTRLNDGWGISQVTAAPVPVPPAMLLAASGIGVMALVRRRRKKAA
jgi:hypothetical protein